MIHDLDLILRNSKAGDRITLPPGLCTTLGVSTNPSSTNRGEMVKPGVTITGSSGGPTTILCIRPWDVPEDCNVVYGPDNNHGLDNVVVDCGCTSKSSVFARVKRNGVYFEGANCTVDNVRVTRPRGDLAQRRESFGISVSLQKRDACWIRNCTVDEICGTYSTPMQGNEMTDCEAIYDQEHEAGVPRFHIGFNVGHSTGARVTRCRTRWAMAGVYYDWRKVEDLVVDSCEFFGCVRGVEFVAQVPAGVTTPKGVRGVVISNNQIWLDGREPQVEAFLFNHTAAPDAIKPTPLQNYISDVTVSDNYVDFVPGPTTACVRRYWANVASFVGAPQRSPDLGITKIRFERNHVEGSLGLRNPDGNAELAGTVTKNI